MKNSEKIMPPDKAKKMIKHFKDPRVKKIKNVAWTEFDVKELIGALSQEDVVSAKFFLAAHPEDHDDHPKRNYPVIVLQLKSVTKGLTPTISYAYFEGTGVICPPPDAPPCNIEDEESF